MTAIKTKKKKITSILKAIDGKPSVALEMMVKGLLKQSKREDFEIHMGTFGSSEDGICYGCCATCAVQEIMNKDFTPMELRVESFITRARVIKLDRGELYDFERAMDNARLGMLASLFRFCYKANKHNKDMDDRFYLTTMNWREEIPKVKSLITYLKKEGL